MVPMAGDLGGIVDTSPKGSSKRKGEVCEATTFIFTQIPEPKKHMQRASTRAVRVPDVRS